MTSLRLRGCIFFRNTGGSVVSVVGCSQVLILSSSCRKVPGVVVRTFVTNAPIMTASYDPKNTQLLVSGRQGNFIIPVHSCGTLTTRYIGIVRSPGLSGDFVRRSHAGLGLFRPRKVFGT